MRREGYYWRRNPPIHGEDQAGNERRVGRCVCRGRRRGALCSTRLVRSDSEPSVRGLRPPLVDGRAAIALRLATGSYLMVLEPLTTQNAPTGPQSKWLKVKGSTLRRVTRSS
jgi:hypothetical protein